MRNFLLTVSILAVGGLAGCASTPDYYAVKARFVASAQMQQPPEITETPAFRTDAGQTTTVAIRAPDSCSNASANQISGNAQSSGSVLSTNCGVRMAEIERALTRAGYRVISWNVLSREMQRGSGQDAQHPTSPIEIADALGAQVLFQINSLEEGKKTLGKDARWDRSYFYSNPIGALKAPLLLDESARSQIRNNPYLQKREQAEDEKMRTPQVTLDANAVWVKTGLSIWYYRWTRAGDPSNTGGEFVEYLSCMTPNLAECDSFMPQSTGRSESRRTRAAGESVAISATEKPEDERAALYAELTSDVVNNFVGSFAESRKFVVPVASKAEPATPDSTTAAPNPTSLADSGGH